MKSELEALNKEFESKAAELRQLYKVLDAKIGKLQAECPHKKKSRWRKSPWSLAYYRSCIDCDKILEMKKAKDAAPKKVTP